MRKAPTASCGYSACRTGWETLCGSQQNTGYSVDGTFAQYGLADPDFVGRLPARLEFGPAAPVLCAGVTVYKGLKETEVRPGEWVLVSGIGGLGHMAVQEQLALFYWIRLGSGVVVLISALMFFWAVLVPGKSASPALNQAVQPAE